MAFIVDSSGNITLVQGDSGRYTIKGLPTDKDYTVYFSIYNEKRNAMGAEVSVQTNYSDTVSFVLSPALTDLLTVKKSQETATYYFGIKVCYEDTDGTTLEDTVTIEDGDIGDLNTMTVYPKKVEGLE